MSINQFACGAPGATDQCDTLLTLSIRAERRCDKQTKVNVGKSPVTLPTSAALPAYCLATVDKRAGSLSDKNTL